jgi:hypothetical protein
MLWWASDQLRKRSHRADVVAEQKATLKALCDEFGVVVTKSPFEPSSNVTAYRIPMDTDGMGASYTSRTPQVKGITLLLYWTDQERLRGSWEDEKKVLSLYPLAPPFLRDYPTHRTHAQDIEYALNEITSTLVHELRHMVQTEIIQHADQEKRKKKYSDFGPDYHTSPIEFDPTIGSCVEEFLQLWDLASEGSRKPSLSSSVKQYCGLSQRKGFYLGPFTTPDFFRDLKKHAPKRYRVAVKKFTVELARRLGVGPG